MFFRFLITVGLILPALCLANASSFLDNSSKWGWTDHSLMNQNPKPAVYSLSDKPTFKLASSNSPEIVITNQQYVLGGVLGTIPGLGIGHVIQQRWTKKGWIFTAGQLGLSIIRVTLTPKSGDFMRSSGSTNTTNMIIGILVLSLKIWEIVDVWAPPSYVKVVGGKEQPLSPRPLLYTHNNQLYKGFKLQFQF